ncbi:hypothetical protein OF83DRAFT_1254961 [Amylostereum chailletii]|nr:hypothetical protein OF83DRAFT_1254961 [Amylostereum chailletii]
MASDGHHSTSSLLISALLLSVSSIFPPVSAASASTSTPTPPLQWINLSDLLRGASPPPLKDASIGYDDSTRTLLIFGGESAGGLPQSQTYLLNLDNMTWSRPSPPSGLSIAPAARSAAIGGSDFAASYRSGHIVIGGKGSDGTPLSDVWEFDYNHQFWSQVTVQAGGPSRFDAIGGVDPSVPFNSSGSQGPSNTFYLMGGVEGSGNSVASLSQVWELQVTGTLSPNLPQSVVASWTELTIGKNPAISGQGGAIVQETLVAFGGCTNTANANVSCAQQASFVVDVDGSTTNSPGACVAPRLGPALVPNRNGVSSSFGSQVFALLGLFNESLWDDAGGLRKGEVGILDIDQGVWARVLPAGDPGSDGTVTFPSPRQGAAALSFSAGLVGSSRSSYSDTLVFGGQDASGNYLDELWLLRAYNASLSSSGNNWSGFGNGKLQTGVNADGQGVGVQFLSSCARALSTDPSATTDTPSPTSSVPTSQTSTPSTTTSSSPQSGSARSRDDTSTTHKILSPLSMAIVLPAIILYRLSLPSTRSIMQLTRGSASLKYLSFAAAAAAYGVGVAGMALSFTSVTSSTPSAVAKRTVPPGNTLKTAHGRAGLALFIFFYGLLPILYGLHLARHRPTTTTQDEVSSHPLHSRTNSTDTAEKLNSFRTPADGGQTSADRSGAASPVPDASSSPRKRQRSWGASSIITNLRSHGGRVSSESVAQSEPINGGRPFEVTNRPRKRQLSASGTMTLSDTSHRMPVSPRSLGDVDWLERRRSVNAVNELDFALQTQRGPPTPATPDVLSTRELMGPSPSRHTQRATMPSPGHIILHSLMHLLVLALCILSLAALWQRAPIATFAVFLVWTVSFYGILVTLAWYGRPRASMITVIISRLRGDLSFDGPTSTPVPSRPLSVSGIDFPTDARGPYLHQPMYRTAHEDEYSASHGIPHSEIEEAESDGDEETRQRRIEDEMGRRDVSIVTVPKRKLWVVNPS